MSRLNPIVTAIRHAYAEAGVTAPFATVARFVHAYLEASVSAPFASASELRAVFDSDNRFLRDRAAFAESHEIEFAKALEDRYAVDEEIQSIDVGKSLNHGFYATDEFSRTIGYGREFVRKFGASEQASLAFSKSLSDPMFWSESSTLLFEKELRERASIDEVFSFQVEKPFGHKLTVSEQFDRTITYNRNFTDSAFFTDDIDGEASVDDDQTMHFTKRTLVGNDFRASEQFDRTVQFDRRPTDQTALSDQHEINLEAQRQSALRVSESHGLSVSKSFSNASALSDQPQLAVTKDQQDAASLSESAEIGVSKSLTDSGAVSESLTTQVSKQPTDAITVSSTPKVRIRKMLNVDSQYNPFRAFVSESYEIGLTKPASNAFTITESLTNQVTKAPSDSVASADTGSLVSQGYVDNNDYFLESYVGTSRSF